MQEEENKLDEISYAQLYSINTIVASSLLGGLFAGGYMLYKNFVSLNEPLKARWTIIGILLLLLIVTGAEFIPSLSSLPGLVYVLFTSIITSVAAQLFQKKLIVLNVKNGARYYSTGNAIIVCILSTLLWVAIAAGAYLLMDAKF